MEIFQLLKIRIGIRIFFCLSLILFFLISNTSTQTLGSNPSIIISIDNLTNANQSLPPVQPSNYTLNYTNFAVFTQNLANGNSGSQALDSSAPNSSVVLILGDESVGVQINHMQVTFNDQNLIMGIDVDVSHSISKNVVPTDYINQNYFVNNNDHKFMMCTYTNLGPYYERQVINQINIEYLVNLQNKNLGLYPGMAGIQVITMQNFTFSYALLDDYIKSNSNSNNINFTPTNNLNFTKLYLSQDLSAYDPTKYYLTAIGADMFLYIYNITDNYNYFNVQQWDIVYTLFNSTNINKIFVYNENVVISSVNSGLTILTKRFNWSKTEFKSFPMKNTNNNSTAANNTSISSIPLVLKDTLIVNSTIFMIIDKFGLVSFDLKAIQFNSNYFLHPNLVGLDYIALNNLFYLGVLVNNNPPSIPEFFIEFAFNYQTPSLPLINKIFVSNTNIQVNNITTDNQLGVTYVLDHNNCLIVLVRGVSNAVESYDFSIDFNNFYTFNSTLGNNLFLVSENDNFYPSLAITNGNDCVLIGKFQYPQNDLTCLVNDAGNYQINFDSIVDCSYMDTNTNIFYYNTCWNNATINFTIDSSLSGSSDDYYTQDRSGAIWIIIGIVVFAVIIIVITVLCCKNRCKKVEVHPQYIKHIGNGIREEEVEIQVMDNKL